MAEEDNRFSDAGAALDIHHPDGSVREFPLPGRSLLIGRPADVPIRLDSVEVSRRHAEVFPDDHGNWWVRDLGSRNGTFVNGRPVKDRLLAAGDIIEIGDFKLIARLPDLFARRWPASSRHNVVFGETVEDRVRTLRDMEPPRVAASHLMTLTDLNQQFANTTSPADRAGALCRMVVSSPFTGLTGMILKVSRARPGEDVEVVHRADREGLELSVPHVSRTVLRAAVNSGEAVLASNLAAPLASGARPLELSISPHEMAQAVIACPLRRQGESVELLYLSLPPEYGTGEWLAMASLAARQFEQAEIVWAARARAEAHAALEHELNKARGIQARLLPDPASLEVHRSAGVDVAIGFHPSHWVSGDYADAIAMRDGRLLLVVADVSGHGLSAALVATRIHTLVHAAVRAHTSLPDLGDSLNDYLRQTLPDEAFVTLLAIALDPGTGQFQCLNAGHPPALLVGKAGNVRELESGDNYPLGVDAATMLVREGSLQLDETLAMYTDGVMEQLDASAAPLRLSGLSALLSKAAKGDTSAAVVATVANYMEDRQGDRAAEDDRTLLLARRNVVSLPS